MRYNYLSKPLAQYWIRQYPFVIGALCKLHLRVHPIFSNDLIARTWLIMGGGGGGGGGGGSGL